jgi:hypothetical protein
VVAVSGASWHHSSQRGAHHAAPGVEGHPDHGRGLDQHGVGQVAELAHVVAAGLRGHVQAGRRGRADHVGHLVGVRRQAHRGGPLVDGEVPGAAGGVVSRVPGQVHRPGAEATQRGRRGEG